MVVKDEKAAKSLSEERASKSRDNRLAKKGVVSLDGIFAGAGDSAKRSLQADHAGEALPEGPVRGAREHPGCLTRERAAVAAARPARHDRGLEHAELARHAHQAVLARGRRCVGSHLFARSGRAICLAQVRLNRGSCVFGSVNFSEPPPAEWMYGGA